MVIYALAEFVFYSCDVDTCLLTLLFELNADCQDEPRSKFLDQTLWQRLKFPDNRATLFFSVYLFCVYFILINTLSVIQNAEMREGNTTLLVIKSVTF